MADAKRTVAVIVIGSNYRLAESALRIAKLLGNAELVDNVNTLDPKLVAGLINKWVAINEETVFDRMVPMARQLLQHQQEWSATEARTSLLQRVRGKRQGRSYARSFLSRRSG